MAMFDIWESVLTFIEGREQAEIVIHHKLEAENEADLEDTAIALLTAVTSKANDIMEELNPTTVQMAVATTHRIKGTAGTSRYFTLFPGATGGVSSDSVGAQLAAVFSKYTDNNSPTERGRTFWPFIARSIQNSGQIGLTVALSVQSDLDALYKDGFSDGQTNSWNGCIWSRKDQTGYEITQVVLRPVLALQRRRVQHKQPFAS